MLRLLRSDVPIRNAMIAISNVVPPVWGQAGDIEGALPPSPPRVGILEEITASLGFQHQLRFPRNCVLFYLYWIRKAHRLARRRVDDLDSASSRSCGGVEDRAGGNDGDANLVEKPVFEPDFEVALSGEIAERAG